MMDLWLFSETKLRTKFDTIYYPFLLNAYIFLFPLLPWLSPKYCIFNHLLFLQDFFISFHCFVFYNIAVLFLDSDENINCSHVI